MRPVTCPGTQTLSTSATAVSGQPVEADSPPQDHFQKVMVVVLENANYNSAMAQPYLKSLAQKGALLSNFHAITHPSQPNYVAFTAGSTDGVTSDNLVNLSGQCIVDLLEASGKSWKVYAEGLPSAGSTVETSGNYARKHNPLISFTSVSGNPERSAKIVNADALDADIQSGTLPDFSMYIPDLRDDGHNTGVAFADKWLQQAFGNRLNNPTFTKGMLFVVTFDEAEPDFGGNQVATILTGDNVQPGAVSKASYNTYSLLRTIEDEFHMGTMQQNDATATPINDVWRS